MKKEAMLFKRTDRLKQILIHLRMLFYVEGKLQRILIHNFGEQDYQELGKHWNK